MVTHITFSFQIEVGETYIFKTWIGNFLFYVWMSDMSLHPTW